MSLITYGAFAIGMLASFIYGKYRGWNDHQRYVEQQALEQIEEMVMPQVPEEVEEDVVGEEDGVEGQGLRGIQ